VHRTQLGLRGLARVPPAQLCHSGSNPGSHVSGSAAGAAGGSTSRPRRSRIFVAIAGSHLRLPGGSPGS